MSYNIAINGYLQTVENHIKTEQYEKGKNLLIDIKKHI